MNELERAIKKYKLDNLLILLADQSKELFLNKEFFKYVEWKQYIGGLLQVLKQPMTAWGLADLSYLAIKLSNEYRSLTSQIEDVYRLNNLLIKVSDDEAKAKKTEVSQEDMKTHILFGLSQKQFWYQEILRAANIYYNFLRYYIMLQEIPLLLPTHRLPDEDLLDITGFNINNFSQLLLAGYAYNYNASSLLNIKISDELKEKYPILTEDNLSKCLAFFIGDYNFYRTSSIPNNPLYIKPLIKTDRGKLIISNSFIWAKKLYEGIYWIIRNKYMEQGSQAFTNKFGEYYERYIEEVLRYYLKKIQYRKIITEGAKNKADWIIETDQYILVIEQKSSLMTIALKEEFPSLTVLDEYLTKNFREAYIQIADTIKTISSSSKTFIKLILHFEKFFLGEAIIKDRVKQLFKDSINDLSNYFFIETEEFEKLIQILSENEDIFNKIIKTKLTYEETSPPPMEGIEFNFIISKYAPVSEIKFLESRRHYFYSLLDK
ncbi:MAG: hypothetical protein FJ240_07870 [Nitrospira sp.]|nr:hypothetical protein [Nitrospira sp.]